MGSGSGTAFGLIGIIIGAGAIGFAFFVWNSGNTTNSDLKSEIDDLTEQLNNLTTTFNDLPRTIVVGNYEGLARNTVANLAFTSDSHWLFEFQAGTHYNGYYVSLFPTRIYLITAGYYRIHLSTLLVDISPSSSYFIEIFKNGVNDFTLYSFDTDAGDPPYFYVDSAAFIYSDGSDYIEINGHAVGSGFQPGTGGFSNRFTIEYVAI